MTEKRKSVLLLCLTTLAALAAVAYFATALSVYFSLGNPGTVDYVQYWSAFRALQQGLNPYDGVVLHEIQLSVGQRPDTTILMWNPPWTCLFLAPFLALPFTSSAALWFLFSVALLFVIARTSRLCFATPNRMPLSVLVPCCALFYPIIECLSWGQISIFITAAFSLTLSLLAQRRYAIAGLSAVPLSIKPHLFFLLIPLLILLLSRVSRAQRRLFILAASSGMLATAAVTELLWPGALGSWMSSFYRTPEGPGTIPTQQWMTATLATILRSFLSTNDGNVPSWPLTALPITAFTIMSAWVLIQRRTIVLRANLMLQTLCLSLLLCSYGWLYDQSLLVLCCISLVCDAYGSKSMRIRALLLGGVAATLGAAVLCRTLIQTPAQHHYTWIPGTIFLLMWLSRRFTKDQRQPLDQAPHLLCESLDPSSVPQNRYSV